MTDNDIKTLFDTTLRKAGVSQLSPKQEATFLLACKRVYLDNPGNDFSTHLMAARIYLNYVLSFPDLTLPTDDVQLPMQ